MPIGLGWGDAPGLAAGALIIGVGVFVLAAKPHSWLHRVFFVLALMDGASTLLLRLFVGSDDGALQRYFLATYFYFFIAFIALLAIFGIVFPKPPRSAAMRLASTGAVLLLGVGVAALYLVDHALFWRPGAAIAATVEPVGNLLNIAFVLVIALLVLRSTYNLLHETSRSHRRQSAYVLGGMSLAYLPYPWTVTMQDLASRGLVPFYAGRWDRVLAHWVFLAACLVLVATAIMLWQRRTRETRDETRFILGCYLGVAVLAIVSLAQPDALFGYMLRGLALLSYPLLLGYAIVRYEVFDIDRKLRRAATVTLTAMGLAVAFVFVESLAENALQTALFGGLRTTWVSGSAAAIVTTIASVPLVRASRKAAAKIVPELSHDELYHRKLEIYRHSLAGAMADGILREGESRTLAALRSSLGVSDAEHSRLLAETIP